MILWEEFMPRGNMVHQGIAREDGVQDQLVLGSLKSSQDLHRTSSSSARCVLLPL